MNLWIVGNGFDLHHGLPTSFLNFSDYLKDKNPDVFDFFNIILFGKDCSRWNAFEANLAVFDMAKINRVRSHKYQEGRFWEDYTDQIKIEFASWAKSVNRVGIDRKMDQRLFAPGDMFFSFNYTTVLEQVYGIDSKRILHIHGIANNSKSIVFGHNVKPKHKKHPREVYDYLGKTYKNADKIIEANESYFNSLKYVGKPCEIYVLGCSMSAVDRKYFSRISRCFPHTYWHISVYSPSGILNNEEKDSVINNAKQCHIKDHYLDFFDMNELSA